MHRYQGLGLGRVPEKVLTSAPHHQDLQPLRYLDGVPSSFQFLLPLGSGGALHLPASSFLPPPKDKCLSPELPLPKQLVCRWAKVSGAGKNRARVWVGWLQVGSASSRPPPYSVTSPLSSCKTLWTTSTTTTSSPRRMQATAATGRAAPAMAVASMPGEGGREGTGGRGSEMCAAG